jgi:hypothetical protein
VTAGVAATLDASCCRTHADTLPLLCLSRTLQVALRKILKKYDKLRGGQRGRNFLQHCWRLPSGGAFLHSPLLDELKAIQVGQLVGGQTACWPASAVLLMPL